MILPIVAYGHPTLKKVAEEIGPEYQGLDELIDNMFETMYAAPGIGLAATQVNVHQRVLVIDLSEDQSEPRVFINPEVTVLDPDLSEYDEGCLSVPGYYETVNRPRKIEVRALNRQGEVFTEALDGLLATCLQHEIDHLNGKLFVDYLSPLKRQRIRKKLEKEQRQRA